MIARTAPWLAALALLAGPCLAQMPPCPGASEPGQKVLVDDIRGAQSMVLDLLEQRLDAALAKLQLENRAVPPANATGGSTGIRVRALRCNLRRPAGRASFPETMAQGLYNNEVVLEVWGETEALPAAQGQGYRARVGYALVPLRYKEPTSSQGVVMVERTAKSIDSPENLLALLDQSGTLMAYTMVGSALRLFHAEDYDQSRAQFCVALARMERMGDPSVDDLALREYARQMAQTVVQSANANPAYRGALRMGNPGPCVLDPL